MTPPAAHRVLVVDDEPDVRAAYRALLSHQPEFDVVGEAANGAEAITTYGRLQPAVVLMDLHMPHVSGIDAIATICDRWPGACIVAMTTFGSREYVVAALRAGASGYLLKGIGAPRLIAGLHQALSGDMPLASAVRRELVTAVATDTPARPDGAGPLSPRERELVRWLAHGLSNQQIATRMHLSEGSVKQYLARVADKLDVASRTQILVRSIQLGIVDPASLPPVTGPAV